MLRLFAFVDIIFRSSIKTEPKVRIIALVIIYKGGAGGKGETERGESMYGPRSPPSDKTFALQGIYLNIRQVVVPEKQTIQSFYNNNPHNVRIIYSWRIRKKNNQSTWSGAVRFLIICWLFACFKTIKKIFSWICGRLIWWGTCSNTP